jgi:hypothetical protein
MTKARLDTWQLGALLSQMVTGELLMSALVRARAQGRVPSAASDSTFEPTAELEGLELAPLLASLEQTAIEDLLKAKISLAGAGASIKRQIREVLMEILQVNVKELACKES